MARIYLFKMKEQLDPTKLNPFKDPSAFLMINTLRSFQAYLPVKFEGEIAGDAIGFKMVISGEIQMDDTGVFIEYELTKG